MKMVIGLALMAIILIIIAVLYSKQHNNKLSIIDNMDISMTELKKIINKAIPEVKMYVVNFNEYLEDANEQISDIAYKEMMRNRDILIPEDKFKSYIIQILELPYIVDELEKKYIQELDAKFAQQKMDDKEAEDLALSTGLSDSNPDDAVALRVLNKRNEDEQEYTTIEFDYTTIEEVIDESNVVSTTYLTPLSLSDEEE